MMVYLMKCFLRFLLYLLQLVIWPYSHILRLFRRKHCMPPVQSQLLMHSATSLAAMIRQKKVSCVEVVEAYIARIEAVNPLLNAVVDQRFSFALEEARRVDELIASDVKTEEQLAKETPMLGIPLTVKESIPVQGMSNNAGRVVPKSRKASQDTEAVALAKQAGAIVLCVTNTPELCLFWEAYNNATGRTNNPYDTRRTPGGSSGGEAALLGSAASLVSLASDIVGSGRLPAMFCGVFGHKPTADCVRVPGHMPESKDVNWNSFFTAAVMCRFAEDLPLLMRCSVSTQKAQLLRLTEPVEMSKLKIYYMEQNNSVLCNRVSPEIRIAIRRVLNHFSTKYSITPIKIELPEMDDAFEVASTVMLRMKAPENIFQKSEDDTENWRSVSLEVIKWLFASSKYNLYSIGYGVMKKYSDNISSRKIEKMTKYKSKLSTKLHELLGENGVLILPNWPAVAHYHLQTYYKMLECSYMSVFNLLEMPATSCTMGLNRDKLPLGIQVAACKYQDRLTLGVAREIEQTFGGWVPCPSGSHEHKSAPLVEPV